VRIGPASILSPGEYHRIMFIFTGTRPSLSRWHPGGTILVALELFLFLVSLPDRSGIRALAPYSSRSDTLKAESLSRSEGKTRL
jgi:hypothetical protein